MFYIDAVPKYSTEKHNLELPKKITWSSEATFRQGRKVGSSHMKCSHVIYRLKRSITYTLLCFTNVNSMIFIRKNT
jgi:hypothetical protein